MTAPASPAINPVLKDSLDQARDEARRCDTKATVLLTLATFGVTAVGAQLQRPLPGAAAGTLWSAAGLLILTMILLILVIRPRLVRHPSAGSWLHAARTGPQDLLDSVHVDQAGLDAMVSQAVVTISRIVVGKLAVIRWALSTLVAALLLLAVGMVLAAVL